MTKAVLDASAVTAVLRKESGYENVLPYLRGSIISTVNLAEVYCTARNFGSRLEIDEMAINAMQLERISFDENQAKLVSSIYPQTLGGTVGLADRVCLALGILYKLPVLTGDHDWRNYNLDVEVRFFRERKTTS